DVLRMREVRPGVSLPRMQHRRRVASHERAGGPSRRLHAASLALALGEVLANLPVLTRLALSGPAGLPLRLPVRDASEDLLDLRVPTRCRRASAIVVRAELDRLLAIDVTGSTGQHLTERAPIGAGHATPPLRLRISN